MFIVFEGCDGTGKTTYSKKLFNVLKTNNNKVEFYSPRNTLVGKILDNYLKNDNSINPRVSHLLFSANRWESYNTLNRAVNKGAIFISDRYYFSGVVYTKTLDPTIPFEWLENVDKGLPEPDLVFYLYNDFTSDRKDGEIYETRDFLKRVRKNYEDIYLSKKDNWVPICTSELETKVFKKILKTVENFIY